jgi:Beta/Gamma crystallin
MTTHTTARRALIALSALVMLTSAATTSVSAQNRRNAGGVTVYTNKNFSGESVSFGADTPDLRGYSLNDKISSIRIPTGETWEICQDINYENRCQVLTGSVSDLRAMGWNDRISSLRRVNNGFGRGRGNNTVYPNSNGSSNGPNNARGLVLFARPNFRGSSTIVTSAGNLSGNGLGSAQVRGGAWELCDRSGRCATVTQDVPDLSRLGLAGRITARPLGNDNWNGNSRRR